jgi:hypothetical protein
MPRQASASRRRRVHSARRAQRLELAGRVEIVGDHLAAAGRRQLDHELARDEVVDDRLERAEVFDRLHA